MPIELAKKSAQFRLDELETQISNLEEKRKELLFEVAKEEAREDEEVHKDCADAVKDAEAKTNDAEDRADATEADAEEAWGYLERFGGHREDCLSGALAGSQKLHPLCTCGWNEVATEIERW